MTEFLCRLFIKNHNDVADPRVRQRYGVLSGITGIVLNLCLFLLKFLAGTLTGAISITADAFNNLSDAGTSLVTIIGFKLSAKPADEEHPFGHGRIEYLAGLGISMVIFVVGFELLTTSFRKILHPEQLSGEILLPLLLLIGSVLVKLWMSFFNRKLSQKIHSSAMEAAATDSLTDSVATSAVILGLLVGHFSGIAIDGYLGCAVAFFIMYSGFKTAKDSISPLLGQPADPELVQKIRDLVLQHKEILGMHDLIIHDYGPGRRIISLHAEVPCDGDILKIHDTVDLVEMELRQKLKCTATIHMDPIDTSDAYTAKLRKDVEEIVKEMDAGLSIHDFRIVRGDTHTNLIFDVVTPYHAALSDAQIAAELRKRIREKDPTCFAVIQVERSST